MSELTKRILFAVPAAVLFVTAMWYGGLFFVILIGVILFFLVGEVSSLFANCFTPTYPFFPYTIALWILLLPGLQFPLETASVIVVFLIAYALLQPKNNFIERFSSTLFAGMYAPLGFLTLLLLRDMGSNEQGFALSLSVVLMVWGNDVFAFIGGKFFGKHILAPSISPKKTWEGFFFGFIGSFAGLGIVEFLVPVSLPVSLALMVPAAVLVSIFGPIGDFAESAIKRKACVKDSSAILPGHGGFFDRFDALIVATPMVWAYLNLLQAFGDAGF